MILSILTLFPEMFQGPFAASIIKRAQEKNIVTINFINIRDFSNDAYKTVDDSPYGGGQGMILKVDVMDRALTHAKTLIQSGTTLSVLMTPQGHTYTQKTAQEFSHTDHLIIIAGHYEGYDERIRSLVDTEISIGDYILTGGEIPAMAVADSVVRLLPGIFAKDHVTTDESFSENVLEYPQYTKPVEYKGQSVPSILLSGDHKKILEWKKNQSLERTRKRRPDLPKKETLR